MYRNSNKPSDVSLFVSGDPTQIEQVLLNICINSGHAMTIMRSENEQQGGILAVSLKTIDIDKHFRNFHPDAVQTRYICISISDTGIGMDQETISKMFDPFFTTKEKGTGLGLSMVYNIIHSHGGFIDVFSNKGVGTTTNIYLPADDTVETSITETTQIIYKGAGTVLLIDDEDMIRKIAGNMLIECGYTVLNAENGIIGIELLKENLNSISLVITDMSMPVMSGLEIFNEIKKIKQDVKILLISGYKQDKRVLTCIEQGADFFLQKPFTLKELSKAVYDVLNAQSVLND
jgi:CheY-like chemotaxis protein